MADKPKSGGVPVADIPPPTNGEAAAIAKAREDRALRPVHAALSLQSDAAGVLT